jgi:hypothetical protein
MIVRWGTFAIVRVLAVSWRKSSTRKGQTFRHGEVE